ncbi:MAG: domain S-box-containing protein [Hydrocarboniphaga sp.]|uniref:PAS domain-containing sensor histidine kinase n=1 Tax=Hydrocarboniphaga sp. TaxID=2033016 RepID=UPI00262C3C02|nr:ATP-binding protein [Hydrocarboniphaga sp.]MDB5972844.1 domain S-box-containing protein [Hydrocarboniphaga sp.]
MKLKYYFAAAVIATSALVAAVILGWVEGNASTLATVSIPLFLIGVSAAWFLDALDRRLSDLSQTAHALAAPSSAQAVGLARTDDTVTVIARSLDGVQRRMSELQTRFEQQRAIAEHAPDAMWVLHVESACLSDVNQSFVDLCGLPREQIIGVTPRMFGLRPQADGTPSTDFLQWLIEHALAGERVVAGCTLLTSSGERLPCEVRAAKLPSLPGRTLIGGTLIGISERLKSERALADRLAFEALISKLSTEMITYNSLQIDEGINRALAEIGRLMQADRCYVFTYDDSDRLLACSHEWSVPGVLSLREHGSAAAPADFPWSQSFLQRGEIVNVARTTDLPPEAAKERAAWTLSAVRSVVMVPLRPRPSVPGLVGFEWIHNERVWPPELVFLLTVFGEMISNLLARQVVERELARQHEALERSISELTRSNSELQRFAYAASHDLQEPLRAISGFSDLLVRRYKGRLDATADEYLDFVRDAAGRMRGMINNLLDYSRIDASPRPFEVCDMNEVLNLALANLHASIDELEARIECERLPSVMGDPSQLLQLLQNLISNAIKFHADAPPHVHVECKLVDKEWLISVRDNGIGLRVEDSERIFEVFKRLHAADRYPGSGIGLSVCKRIIERHRGGIWAQPNEDGVGATLWFTLPVLAEDAA